MANAATSSTSPRGSVRSSDDLDAIAHRGHTMKTEQVDNVHKRERKRTAAPSSRRCCAHRHRHAPNPPPGRGRAARRRPGAAWAAQRPYLGRCLARSGWRQIEHSQKRRKSSGIAAGEGGSGSGGGGGDARRADSALGAVGGGPGAVGGT